jgi:hypothetical protein
MAAPTNAAKREETSCQPGAVHTWHKADVAGLAAVSTRSQMLLAAILLHCRSVSIPIGTASLARERVLGIDPAIRVSTTRGGHALGVAGELAIARIAPVAPLQAVAIRPGWQGLKTIGLSLGLPSCQNHSRRQNCQSSAHWNLLEVDTAILIQVKSDIE